MDKYGSACKSKIKAETGSLVKNLFAIIEINHLTSSKGLKSTASIKWSMIADNFILTEENIVITCRLLLRILFLNDEKDVKIEKDLKESVLAFFKVSDF